MKIKQIKEVCLYINDLDEAEKFYHQQLELPVISRVEGRHIFFRVGPNVLLCFKPEVTKNEESLPPHYASGNQHIAFEVDHTDYSNYKQMRVEKGVVITYVQDWGHGFESFYFEDLENNVLEIVPSGLWEK